MSIPLVIICAAAVIFSLRADSVLEMRTLDGGGGRCSGQNALELTVSLGGIGGSILSDHTEAMVVKSGFSGQLYEMTALAVTAQPQAVAEGGISQLSAVGVADDDTIVSLRKAPLWSVLEGPLENVSASGAAAAALVYEDTAARVGAEYGSLSGSAALLVLNTESDNFGAYAGDGVEDGWQVRYFGLDNPAAAPDADPDNDTQNNAYEWITGTIPTNDASRFSFRIEIAPVPGQMDLLFEPAFADRIYQVERRGSLTAGVWAPLTVFDEYSNGPERTVRDLAATNSAAFYRVKIFRGL